MSNAIFKNKSKGKNGITCFIDLAPNRFHGYEIRNDMSKSNPEIDGFV